jgi:hypothetical protein
VSDENRQKTIKNVDAEDAKGSEEMRSVFAVRTVAKDRGK